MNKIIRKVQTRENKSMKTRKTNNDSVNIKLYLILRFKSLDYTNKVEFQRSFMRLWRKIESLNSLELAKNHLQEIVRLARLDEQNLIRHVKYLNNLSQTVTFEVSSTDVQFNGLSRSQYGEQNSK